MFLRHVNLSRRAISTLSLSLISLALLLLCAASPLRADITIKFDDLKDGDKISDVAVIIVRADSGDGIDKVEFAVDDQLRFSSGSTPYTYKWDTIPDKEGPHTLAVTAIDANGVKKTVTLSLNIDNEIGLGASALAQKARAALDAKDLDTATKYSRRALKAEPDNIEASRALAAVLADRLNWDKAISTLEQAKNINASAPAMLELASYRMRRAVLPENAPNLVSDIQAAGELRRKAADLNVEKVKAQNLPADDPKTHEILGDAYLNAGRYREAAAEYSKSLSSGMLSATNRLALAYVLNEQPHEAVVLLRSLIKDKGGDAATRAVMGLALLRQHQFAEARNLVRPDVATGVPASLIVASYADSTLGNAANALKEAQNAVEALPNAGEARYALSMALAKPIESEPEIVRAMALSPFQSGPLLDYAVRYSLLKSSPDKFATALKLVGVVLKNDPDNENAKLIQVLLLFHTNRIPEAEPILSALLKQDKTSADLQAAAAIYFNLKDNPSAVEERMRLARDLDKDFFDLGTVPKPLELLYNTVRKYHYRGGFYLTPTTLYPPTQEKAAGGAQ